MQSRWWLAGVLKQDSAQSAVVPQCTTVVYTYWYHVSAHKLCLYMFMHASKLPATDVLVHMLMKGAAKCNNHCELQNSVNQLTIERRIALGAFLRACLCQCFNNVRCVFFTGTRWLCIKHQAWCIKCCGYNVWSLVPDVVAHILLFSSCEHDIKQSNLLNLSI